jgi:RecJ-like exonuclease
MQLLSELDIPLRNGKGLRTLGELTREERRRLASELIVRCITKTSPDVARLVPNLIIGSVYRMVGEGSPLQYASEYATVVNSAARMGLTQEAVGMLLGDRNDQYRKVISGLGEYRRIISQEVRSISGRRISIGKGDYLQYFISESTSRNLIGPVTGLVLGSGMADPYKPLVGMVSGHVTKASSRCSRILVLEGLDLSSAASRAAKKVGGEGGGHRGAAGAFFPSGSEEDFVDTFERELLAQRDPREPQ